MNGVILTTKGTTKSYRSRGIIGGVIMGVAGLFVLIIFFVFSSRVHDNRLVFFLIIALFMLFDAFVTIAVKCAYARSYVDIYGDRLVGKGIRGLNVVDFNIQRSQVSNITAEGSTININTVSGAYKIITNKDTAQKVFYYYNHI